VSARCEKCGRDRLTVEWLRQQCADATTPLTAGQIVEHRLHDAHDRTAFELGFLRARVEILVDQAAFLCRCESGELPAPLRAIPRNTWTTCSKGHRVFHRSDEPPEKCTKTVWHAAANGPSMCGAEMRIKREQR
jgi:hypothetical protein